MIEMLELCVVSNVLPCELMKIESMPKKELGEHMEERKQRAADQRLGSNFLPLLLTVTFPFYISGSCLRGSINDYLYDRFLPHILPQQR
jgi:hypothetical protein